MNPSKVIVHTKSPCQLYLSSPHRSFLPDHTLILFFSFIITGSVNSGNIIILRNAPSGFAKTLVDTNAGFTGGGLQILVYLLWPANSCEIAKFYSTMKAILFSGWLLMYATVTWTKENRENNKSSSHADRNKSTQCCIHSHFLDTQLLLLFQIKLDSIAKNKCRP